MTDSRLFEGVWTVRSSGAVDQLIRQGYVLEQDRASLSAGTLGEP